MGSEGGGYGNPPQNSRFKKGRSGNPKGRPKGSFNLATKLEKALRATVVVQENGMRKVISKLEAAATQLVNKAAAGDINALKTLAALTRVLEPQNTPPGFVHTNQDADQKVMQSILKRIARKGEESDK